MPLNFLFGSPANSQQLPRLSGSQQNLQESAITRALQMLQGNQSGQQMGQQNPGGNGGYGGFDFEPIENQARQNFNTQTIPTLLDRFTAMSGDTRNSSALQGALGAAGAGLESNLAALKSQYGLQQQGQQDNLLANLLNQGLQPQFDTNYQSRQPGLIENTGSGLSQGLGFLLPLLLGGGGGGLQAILKLLMGS